MTQPITFVVLSTGLDNFKEIRKALTAESRVHLLAGLTTANVVITRQGGVPVLPQTVTVQIVGFKHQPLFDLGLMINSPSLSLNIDVKPSVTMRYLLTQPPV